MSILVIDYGMGNLASVRRALQSCGASVTISDNPDSIDNATKLVLPGVGSFAMAMNNIKSSGWQDKLEKAVLVQKMPLLGICLGMQLLADEGEEHGVTPGLAYIHGRVRHFDTPALRVPHVGWNEIKKLKEDRLVNGLDNGTDFYFVHSYYFDAANQADVVATTPYGSEFPSIIANRNVWGTQFHPEKSGAAGFQILRNFVAI